MTASVAILIGLAAFAVLATIMLTMAIRDPRRRDDEKQHNGR